MLDVFVDAEGIVGDWVNTLAGLVGSGNPLAGGAKHKHRRATPYSGAYLLLKAGQADDNYMTGMAARHILFGEVWGTSQKQACDAAVAYANALRQLEAGNTPMPTALAPVAVCVGVDNISGPRWAPTAAADARYLVDATFVLYAVPA